MVSRKMIRRGIESTSPISGPCWVIILPNWGFISMVLETTTMRWSEGGRTFLKGTNSFHGRMRGTKSSKKSVDEGVSLSEIDGYHEQRQWGHPELLAIAILL